ncbi:MAG: hypothetical protein KTM48_04365 [Wolbachia endosymbiont of Pissodes strobi]|nr:hypothetical protein [Wolbachia endosymbiont of Pissodes strobi]
MGISGAFLRKSKRQEMINARLAGRKKIRLNTLSSCARNGRSYGIILHPRNGHREDDREEGDLGCRMHLRADNTQRQGSQQRMGRRRLNPKHKVMAQEQNSRE